MLLRVRRVSGYLGVPRALLYSLILVPLWTLIDGFDPQNRLLRKHLDICYKLRVS